MRLSALLGLGHIKCRYLNALGACVENVLIQAAPPVSQPGGQDGGGMPATPDPAEIEAEQRPTAPVPLFERTSLTSPMRCPRSRPTSHPSLTTWRPWLTTW